MENKRNELAFFTVENAYGWHQEWFSDYMMRLGGCGAVTACDSCIYLKKYSGIEALYPFDANEVTKEDYLAFSKIMKPYLKPRWQGIDRLEIYTEGMKQYLKDIGETSIDMQELDGSVKTELAKEAVIKQIELGFPIPCLILNHKNRNMKDYVWHWFLITGYEAFEEILMVKIVTYGTWKWVDFDELWNTGHRKKGGLILYEKK